MRSELRAPQKEPGERTVVLAEVRPLSLLMRENPEAFEFPDLRPEVGEKSTTALETMLGDFTRVEKGFTIRPIKLKQQKALLRCAREAGTQDDLAALEQITRLMTQLLCKEEEGGDLRPATEEEIETAFSAQELLALLKEFTGLGPTGKNSKNV